MSENKNYWITLFTETAWEKFSNSGSKTVRYPKRRWRTAKKISPGDILICYVKEPSMFTAVFEAESASYLDESDTLEPGCVDARPIATLPMERGVDPVSLRDTLSIFRNAENPIAWTDYFRNSPMMWDPHDGAAVVRAVEKAAKGETESGPQFYLSAMGAVTAPPGEESVDNSKLEIAGILLRIGSGAGLGIWAAPKYRGLETDNGRINDIPGLLAKIPYSAGGDALIKTLELADAVWFEGDRPSAVMVIGGEGSVDSALIRLADIMTLDCPGSLYMALPGVLIEEAITEIYRPAFASLNPPLNDRVKLLIFDDIRRPKGSGAAELMATARSMGKQPPDDVK